MKDGEGESLENKVEEGVKEENTCLKKKRENKTTTMKEKVERVEEKRAEEETSSALIKPSTPTQQPPQLQIPELKLVKPVVKKVIQIFPTQSLHLNVLPLKYEPLKLIKPRLLTIQPQPAATATINESLPEVPKIKLIKPTLKLPPTIEEKPPIVMMIPKIEIRKPTKITPNVSQITTQDIVETGEVSLKLKVGVEEQKATTITTTEDSIVFFEEDDPSQLPVIPDVMLDPSSEGGSLGSVTPEGPVYVIVTEGLYEIITMLCGLVYRIKTKEGLPSTWVEGNIDADFLKRTLVERDLVIMEAKDIVNAFKNSKLEEVAKEFRERIEGIRKEGRFRFIVLKTPLEVLDEVEKLLKENLARYVSKLLIYKPNEMNPEAWGLLIKTCWGFVKSDKPAADYNECANIFQEQINNVVKQVENKLPAPKWPKSSPSGENWLHRALKYVVINHFLENERIDLDSIETEYVDEIDKPPIDVYVRGKNIAIEIETLYGRGEPKDRIRELLDRYQGFKGQLWLVFPNQQALLFCDDIVRVAKDYRKVGLTVEPYIVDISGEGGEILNGRKTAPGLIKLVSVIKLLRNKGIRREVKWLGELSA